MSYIFQTRLTLTLFLQDLFLKDRSDHEHVMKNPPVNTDITSRGLKTKTRALGKLHASGSSVDPHPSKKRKLILNTPETDDSAPQPGEQRLIRNPPLVEKAPSQNIVRSISILLSFSRLSKRNVNNLQKKVHGFCEIELFIFLEHSIKIVHILG